LIKNPYNFVVQAADDRKAEAVVLSVLGVGGPCALAPGDAGVGGASGFASIPLVLDVAGYGYVENVPITLVEVASTESCTSP